jgi:hypothetical protein
MADGQRAGLSLFGVRPSWIGVVRQGGKARITLADAGQEVAGEALATSVVDLRAEVGEDRTVRYSWRVASGEWRATGQPIELSPFSWWKGSRPALFSFNPTGAGGVADFDWFHVTAD